MSLPRTTAEALIALVEALDYSGMLKSAPDEVLLAVGHARSRLAIDAALVSATRDGHPVCRSVSADGERCQGLDGHAGKHAGGSGFVWGQLSWPSDAQCVAILGRLRYEIDSSKVPALRAAIADVLGGPDG